MDIRRVSLFLMGYRGRMHIWKVGSRVGKTGGRELRSVRVEGINPTKMEVNKI
jgi:hypothetical protein